MARVQFCVHEGRMILLHAFIKKTQKTPHAELNWRRRAPLRDRNCSPATSTT
ncbi:hypothetical protein C2U70_08765 [Bradyrhizobium guangdongense]|nr:hypothetical protein C2U70_08765 [Bradyrhizobium guangdongense]